MAAKQLMELKGSPESADGGLRRWFASTEMDLIVWYDASGLPSRFELYYDKHRQEHVIIWRAGDGMSLWAVDDGEQKPVLEYKEAPILVPDGAVDPGRVRRLFEKSSARLPGALVELVIEKLNRHGDVLRRT